MFRTVPLPIIRSFSLYTQQWYMSYSLQTGSGRNVLILFVCKLSANLYVLLCVQWKTPYDGQRNCPKHVEFYSKNKCEKLVCLVGFIIRNPSTLIDAVSDNITVYGPQMNNFINTRWHAVEGGSHTDTAVTSPNRWTPTFVLTWQSCYAMKLTVYRQLDRWLWHTAYLCSC